MLRKFICIFVLLLPLSACLSGKKTSSEVTSTVPENTKLIILTAGQERIYQDAIKSILPTKSSVKFEAVKTLKFETQEGYHTCGYANYKNEAGQKSETPFYIELRKTNEQYAVHRGQVGTDDGKKAKVKFVCRHHQI